ncbi:MAG: sigma-70 family RNA polymerase sigma factor [Clostridia bacterium]|nr:sigma-70 family RNA polymerase sigma factor [Clostridia bacterium]
MECKPTASQFQAPVALEIDELFREYADMVYRLALVRTRNGSDAEDVLQDVFFRCVRKQPQFTDREHQKAWLIKVTINCSKNVIGNAFRRHTVSEDALVNVAAEAEEKDSTVYEAVMKLPAKYRTAIHLHYYEGYSVAEIAKMTDANESTVKSWLFRARGLLKEQLKGEF